MMRRPKDFLPNKLNRYFYRAGHIQSFHPRIDFAYDDNAGFRDFLAVLAIEDGYVRARRPDPVSRVPLRALHTLLDQFQA